MARRRSDIPAKMLRWSVYRIDPGKRGDERVLPLGYVRAEHHPRALLQAFAKWPKDLDPDQVQAGLVVRLYEDDPYELGAKAVGAFLAGGLDGLAAALAAMAGTLHHDDAVEALARSICEVNGRDPDRNERRWTGGDYLPAWRDYEAEAERLFVQHVNA